MNPDKIFSISAFQGMNEFSWNKFKEKNLGFNMNITVKKTALKMMLNFYLFQIFRLHFVMKLKRIFFLA
jgi:hypothetical protein